MTLCRNLPAYPIAAKVCRDQSGCPCHSFSIRISNGSTSLPFQKSEVVDPYMKALVGISESVKKKDRSYMQELRSLVRSEDGWTMLLS